MSLPSQPAAQQFLGSEATSSYEAARVVIVPIPYEATTTYRKGCERGPEALLTASDQLEAYDEELKRETCREVPTYTTPAIADSRQNPHLPPEEMVQVVTEALSRPIAEGKFVMAVGGEHGITTGVVRAYQQAMAEPFTVVQIDAHGDLRAQYQGSLHNHACVMRRIVEMGLPTLGIGLRAVCREEAQLIEEKGLPVFWAREMAADPDWIEKAIARIETPKVFLTLDVDGLDPSWIPGVGTPEPGGLGWYETLKFLRRLLEAREAIGCDVMELAPLEDSVVSEFSVAKLVYKLIGYQALSQGWFR